MTSRIGPKPGVMFKDITPLLNDGRRLRCRDQPVSSRSTTVTGRRTVDRVLGIEARGLRVRRSGGLPSSALGSCPVRKAGKLPFDIEREEYVLEYGVDLLEIHRDAVQPGEQVLILDDVLATGGTAAATARLVEKLGGRGRRLRLRHGAVGFLHGRSGASPATTSTALITYGGDEPSSTVGEGEGPASVVVGVGPSSAASAGPGE